MTHRRAGIVAAILMAASLAACGEPAEPGLSPTPEPTAEVIPTAPAALASPSSTASPTSEPSPTETPSPAPVPPEIEAFREAVRPTLEALNGVNLVVFAPVPAVCGGEEVQSASVQVQTIEEPTPDEIYAIMDTAHAAAAVHAPDATLSLQISPDVESSAQFLCRIPEADQTVAEVVADGFEAEWVFTLVSPIGDTGLVQDADPDERALMYAPASRDNSTDVDILALLPDTWEAGTRGAEQLGWQYSYLHLGGGMLIEGMVPAPVGSSAPEEFAEFWRQWSEFGWDVVGAGGEDLPFLGPDGEGGIAISLTLAPGIEELLPPDQAEFERLTDWLKEMVSVPVTVEVSTQDEDTGQD